jgi:sarcosine oxidase subunit delta
MSFVLECPHCGVREVADFAFGGEVSPRPKETPTFRELCEYNYFRRNVAGIQREWWYHRSGCRTWFQADRDTRTNEVLRVGLPGSLPPSASAGAVKPATEGGPTPVGGPEPSGAAL